MYTSYFANIRNLPSDFQPVSISRFSPKWLRGEIPEYKTLAPFKEMLNNIPQEEYITKYNDILNSLDAQQVYEEIQELASGKIPVMCCYEKPSDFCHRHLAAKWLNSELGLDINEWQNKKPNFKSLF